MTDNLNEIIQRIVAGDSRFSDEAYEFAAEAMEAALSEWHVKQGAESKGFVGVKMPSKQLVVALQRLSSERFGKCATATFNLWGITRWQDFAEIVSRMQEANVSLFAPLAFSREDFKGRGVLDDVFPES